MERNDSMAGRKGTAAWILAGFMCVWLCVALAVLPAANGPLILPDEFGYWAHAAHMAGMDWTRVVSTHSWYSFGYGLLMLPFMKLAADPVALYRLMLGTNILLMWAATLLLYDTLKKIFDGADRRKLALVSGSAMLYVSCVTYAQTTMAEALLVFLYVLLAWGMARWLAEPGVGNGIFVVLTAGYMYMVHMRTIGIVLAACVAGAGAFRGKGDRRWKRALWLLLALGSLVLLTGLIKERLIGAVASESYAGMARMNSYGGQWGKIGRIFSPKGAYQFLVGLAGKLFYLGCASFGLYYWGMAFLARRSARLLTGLAGRKRGGALWREGAMPTNAVASGEEWDLSGNPQLPGGGWGEWLCLWVLLSHVAALLITNISSSGFSRLDGILYGRYHENTAPVIIAFGMAELLGRPGFKRRFLWLVSLLGACFFAVYALFDTGEVRYMNLHSVTGIIYAALLADRYDARAMLYAYLAGLWGGVATLAAFWFARGGGSRRVLLLAACLAQLGLSCYNIHNYTLPAYAAQEEETELLLAARQMLGEGREMPYLYDGKGTQIYLAQYMLRDVSLRPVLWEELSGQEVGNLVLVQKGDGEDRLQEGYVKVMESARYQVYWRES